MWEKTRYQPFDALEHELADRPDWIDRWLYERVNIGKDGALKFECMPPSPDGWKAALNPNEWDDLKQRLQFRLQTYNATVLEQLQKAIFSARRTLEKDRINGFLLVLHPSWRDLVFVDHLDSRLLGIDVEFHDGPTQVLLSEPQYGRWVEIFPGELAGRYDVREQRRRRLNNRRAANDADTA